MLQGYICVGATAAGQIFENRRGGGIDLVWDLWNEQFSVLTYPEDAIAWPSVGAGLTAYAGFGFGKHDDVHQAWSGQFNSAEASIGIDVWKLVSIQGQVSYFESPKRTTVGGLAGVTASVSVPEISKIFRLPLDASLAVTEGHWTPFDAATRMYFLPIIRGSRLRRLSPVEVAGRPPKSYFGVDLAPANVWAVPLHLAAVLGPLNPLVPGFALYASTVALVKEYMRANNMGNGNRDAGFDELHRWVCSEPYRLIRRYEQDQPHGTSQMQYDNNRYTVARTPNGKYIITATVGGSGAVGAWSTTMRLHNPDASHGGVPSVQYNMAARGAGNAFINGRSVSMMKLSDELMKVRKRMNEAPGPGIG